MTARDSNLSLAAETALSGTFAVGATVLNVTSTASFPAVPFYVVVDPDVDDKREVIYVDEATTGTTMTLSSTDHRGLDGSTAVEHSVDAKVIITPVPGHFTDLHDRIDAVAATVVTSHAELDGLGEDDHVQYLTEGRHDDHDHSQVPGVSGLLGVTTYAPGSVVERTALSSTPVDLDATNLAVTFTAPASGEVLVRLTASAESPEGDLLWGLREGESAVSAHFPEVISGYSVTESLRIRASAVVPITGLTAGAAHTYKWSIAKFVGSSAITSYGGNRGPAVMEVWAVPT